MRLNPLRLWWLFIIFIILIISLPPVTWVCTFQSWGSSIQASGLEVRGLGHRRRSGGEMPERVGGLPNSYPQYETPQELVPHPPGRRMWCGHRLDRKLVGG